MKSIIAVAALSALSAPAFAGPYVNIENNAAWVGNGLRLVLLSPKTHARL